MILWLIPFLGVCQLGLLSATAIILNKRITHVIPLAAALSVIELCGALYFFRPLWRRDWISIRQILKRKRMFLVLPTVLLLFVASPALRFSHLSSPYRIGIDQIGSATAAKFLIENGRLNDLVAKLLAETHNEELFPMGTRIKTVNLSLEIQSDALLLGLRWGLPALIAEVSLFFNKIPVFEIQYLILALFYLGFYSITHFGLVRLFRFKDSQAVLPALALAMNCNLLNNLAEGQLAQIFSQGAFSLIWLSWYALQKKVTSIERTRWVVFFLFLYSHILYSYNDLFLVNLGLTALVLGGIRTVSGIPALFRQKYYIFLIGFICLVNSPFLYRLLSILPQKMSLVRSAGTWQPHWAAPSEILGFQNMFTTPWYYLHDRSVFNIGLTSLLSVLVVIPMIYWYKKRGIKDTLMWSMPLLFVIVIFIKLRFRDHIHNYSYMKAYCFVLPLVWLSWVSGLKDLMARLKWRPKLRNAVFSALFFPIAVSGASYMFQYNREAASTTPGMQRISELSAGYHLEDFIVLSPRDGLEEITLSVYMPFNWARSIDVSKEYNQVYLDRPVILLYKKRDLKCPTCWNKSHYKFVIETDDFLLLGLNRTLRNVYDPVTHAIHSEKYLILEML